MDMQTAVAQPAAPAPVQAPVTPAPQVSDAQRLVDSIFAKTNHVDDNSLPVNAPAPVSPAGPAPVSVEPQQLTPAPTLQPGTALPQQVNTQPAAEAQHSENPLPAGVRQRLSELTAERNELRERMAQLEGFMMAQAQNQQQQAQRQSPPPIPDMVQDPQGYAAYVQQQAVAQAEALVQRERQAIQSQVAEAQKFAAKAAWQTDRMNAVQTYGAETVAKVEQMMRDNPKLGNAYSYDQNGRPVPNAYTRAAADLKQREVLQQIPNGDINAYKQAVIAEYLKTNPQAMQAQAAQYAAQQRQPVVAPQSLAALPGNNAFATLPADPMDDLRQMDLARKQRMQTRAGF